MIRLVYISQAVKPFSSQEVLKLLRTARVKNAANNISGVLLNCDECFIQVLEGCQVMGTVARREGNRTGFFDLLRRIVVLRSEKDRKNQPNSHRRSRIMHHPTNS